MKQRTRFLRALLLGLGLTMGTLAPAFADTVWNTAVTSTDNLLTEANWTSGAPSLTNLGTIGTATIGITADQTLDNTIISITDSTITSKSLYLSGTDGASSKLTVGGTTTWGITGNFVGLNNNTGTGWVDFTLTDSAKLTTGNFWGGAADKTSAKPLTDQTYAQSYTFSGDSVLESSGEFWVGMSAKTYVKIEGNASVTQKAGNQCGIGWGGNAAGSVIDMTGGTLNIAITTATGGFCVGRSGSGTMNQSGGTATVEKMQIGGGSVYALSGTGVLTVTGGTHGATVIDPMLGNSGTINQSGGTLSTTKYSGGGTANLTGGTFTASSLTNTGAINVNTGGTLAAAEIGGKVVVDGGTLTQYNQKLYLQGGSDVTLKTGSIAPTSSQFWIGSSAGTATFTQTGGAVSFSSPETENVVVGAVTDSVAVMNISGGTFTVSAPSIFCLSGDDNASATVNVSGSAAFNTQSVSVGQHGSGTLLMSGTSTWTTNGKDFLSGWDDAAATAAITLSDSAALTTGNVYPGYAASGSTGVNSLTLNDSAKINITGNFVPFRGADVENKSGTGQVNVTLNGSSSLYVSGNVWGGSNDNDNTVAPMTGQDYAFNLSLNGNSTLSCGELWAAMSAKTHLTIADNASVTARGGSNSGIGWGTKAANSRIDITGGSLTVNSTNLAIQNQGTFDQSGGSVTARIIQIVGGSQYLVSDGTTSATASIEQKATLTQSGGEIKTPAFNTAAGSTTTLTGGTLTATTVSNAGTITLDGGTLAINPYGTLTTNAGTFNAISGTVDFGLDSGISWQSGDQVILGKFQDAAQQAAVFALAKDSLNGWTTGTDATTGYSVAAFGDTAKTDLKIWKDGTSGSMATADNWTGDVNNRTGFVNSASTDVTNTFSDFSGVLVVNGGANTFNGSIEASERLVVNAGTNTYAPTAFSGELYVNTGTFNTAGSLSVNGTAENPGSLIFNGGTAKINGDLLTATSAGSSASIALEGSANVTVTGSFISLSGNKNTGRSLFTMTDNAAITTGNFWGGKSSESSAQPLAGRDYAAEYIFSGNSYLECKEFWVGMSVPTHVVLEGNAHVKSTSNNTGIGWSNSAANSLFEQKGGTLESVNVKIGESNNTAVLNWIQTGGAWTATGTFLINSPNAVYSLSGADSSLKITGEAQSVNKGAILVSGGSLSAVWIENHNTLSICAGAMNLSKTFDNMAGGTLNVSGVAQVSAKSFFHKSGATLNVSGGELTASTLYFNGGSTTNLSGGKLTMDEGIIGNSAGTVTYNQTGGEFAYNSIAGRLQFASAAGSIANVNISGGTFTSMRNMDISDAADSVVNFNLSGSGQVIGNLCSNIGRTGVVYISMTDNSSYTNRGTWVYLGGDSSTGRTSTLTMAGNSQFTAAGTTTIGFKGNGEATIGGASQFQPATLVVGKDGIGSVTVKESGTVNATVKADVAAKGTVTVEGGAFLTPTMTNAGTVTVSGGTLATNSLTNNNTVSVSDGLLQAPTITNAGTVTVSGGTLAANSLTNNNTVSISDGLLQTATMTNAGTVTVSGGTLQTAGYTQSSAGTTNLSDDGTISLVQLGTIKASEGTFNSNSGAISVAVPASASDGYQVLVGQFANATAATAAKNLVMAPEGWTASVINDTYVVLTAGTAPTDMRIWKAGNSGSMAESANWDGTPANPVGFVTSGTNSFTDFAGTVVVQGGTNTFNANVDKGETLAINGGTNTVVGTSGTLIVNDGTTKRSDTIRVYGTVASPAKLDVNGGLLSSTAWLAVGDEADTSRTNASGVVTVTGGTVTANGIILGDHKNTWGDYRQSGGNVALGAGGLMIAGQNPGNEDKSGTKGTFALSGGTITVNADTNLAQSNGSQGSLTMTGGTFNGQTLNLGRTNAGADAVVDISGGTMTLTKTVSGGGQLKVSGTGTLAFNSAETADEISGLSAFEIAGSGANNSGAIQFLKSGTINVSPTLTADAGIRVESGATVDLLKPVLESAGSNSTLTKLGTGTLNLGVAGSTVSGLNVAQGVMALNNIDYAGAVTVGSSGTLKVNNTGTASQTFSAPVSAQGNVVFSGTGGFNVVGPYQLDGGTFTVDSGTFFNIGEETATTAQTLHIAGTGTFDFNGDLVIQAYGPYSCDTIDLSGLTGNKTWGQDASLSIILNEPYESYDSPYTEFAWLTGMDGTALQDIDWKVVVPAGYDYDFKMDANGRIFSGDRNLVPEPSTYLLLLVGVGGLTWFRRKRRQKTLE